MQLDRLRLLRPGREAFGPAQPLCRCQPRKQSRPRDKENGTWSWSSESGQGSSVKLLEIGASDGPGIKLGCPLRGSLFSEVNNIAVMGATISEGSWQAGEVE